MINFLSEHRGPILATLAVTVVVALIVAFAFLLFSDLSTNEKYGPGEVVFLSIFMAAIGTAFLALMFLGLVALWQWLADEIFD